MTTAIKPLFTSAPRVKIFIDNKVIAYAVGFNINISVDVQPVYIVGQYAPVSLEPTMYNIVTGTMQIIRLKNKITRENDIGVPKTPGLSDPYNSANPKRLANSQAGEKITLEGAEASQLLEQRRLFSHLNPAELLASSTFDILLYIKVPKIKTEGGTPTTYTVVDPAKADTVDLKPWIKVLNCRITSRNTNISIGQLVNEPVAFQGLLATPVDDSGGELFKHDGLSKESVS